jgi:hypothetical protein
LLGFVNWNPEAAKHNILVHLVSQYFVSAVLAKQVFARRAGYKINKTGEAYLYRLWTRAMD